MEIEERPKYVKPRYGKKYHWLRCTLGVHDWYWTPGDYSESYFPTYCVYCGKVMPEWQETLHYKHGFYKT